jgi:hypothetical protein
MKRTIARLVACSLVILAHNARAADSIPNDSSFKDKASVEAARVRAVAGSADDSYRLSLHFLDATSFDFEHYIFYLRLSAEQGSCEGILAQKRLERSDSVDASVRTGTDWGAKELELGCRARATFDR